MVIVAQFKFLLENTIFLATATSLFIAQLLKMVIYMLHYRRRGLREVFGIALWRTGGMPSSHSALVCCLTVSIAFEEGISSTSFVLSFWFALVVLRDSLGVRRSAGLQARALNNLGKQVLEKDNIDFHPVKEIQGHSPLEVVVGGLLGIFIAAGFALL
jgi:acid phosphatase family membrane protein YuiD